MFYQSMEFVFIGAQAADLLTTFKAIDSGAGYEGNPFGNLFIQNKTKSILFKATGTMAILHILKGIKKRNKTIATITLIILNVSFGYIAYHNSRIK